MRGGGCIFKKRLVPIPPSRPSLASLKKQNYELGNSVVTKLFFQPALLQQGQYLGTVGGERGFFSQFIF